MKHELFKENVALKMMLGKALQKIFLMRSLSKTLEAFRRFFQGVEAVERDISQKKNFILN